MYKYKYIYIGICKILKEIDRIGSDTLILIFNITIVNDREVGDRDLQRCRIII